MQLCIHHIFPYEDWLDRRAENRRIQRCTCCSFEAFRRNVPGTGQISKSDRVQQTVYRLVREYEDVERGGDAGSSVRHCCSVALRLRGRPPGPRPHVPRPHPVPAPPSDCGATSNRRPVSRRQYQRTSINVALRCGTPTRRCERIVCESLLSAPWPADECDTKAHDRHGVRETTAAACACGWR
jgi:hypothetical protein